MAHSDNSTSQGRSCRWTIQSQFIDPEAFLNEARILGDCAERKLLGFLRGQDQHPLEVFGRIQRVGQETVGRVFSFLEVAGREQPTDPLPEGLAVPPDLSRAEGVPWQAPQRG